MEDKILEIIKEESENANVRKYTCVNGFGYSQFERNIADRVVKLFCQPVVSGSAIIPPLGLIPKKFHDERVKAERFNKVCGAIARYYDAGLKINIEWIEEYNELVECVGKHYR